MQKMFQITLLKLKIYQTKCAEVVELVDTLSWGGSELLLVEVQILSSAPIYLTKFNVNPILLRLIAGWSSLVARRAHNPKVVGSNPAPATNYRRLV